MCARASAGVYCLPCRAALLSQAPRGSRGTEIVVHEQHSSDVWQGNWAAHVCRWVKFDSGLRRHTLVLSEILHRNPFVENKKQVTQTGRFDEN